jgi:beta-glucosidase
VGVLSGGGSSQVRSVGGAPVEIPLTSGAAASFARVTYHASSPLVAIRAIAPDAEVSFLAGDDPQAAAQAARGADAVIVFATQWTTEAQDAETLSLPNDQDALIAAVAAANPNTAVVLETGGPVLMPWIEAAPAVVQAWYPGQRGGEAIARVLFGQVNPSGRLPITFPRSADQPPRPTVPGLEALKASDVASNAGSGSAEAFQPFPVDYPEGSDVGYRWYEREARRPLFPFGHGLSYTRFQYADLRIEGGERLTVSFDVTNVGDRAGTDVPQLYVSPQEAGAPRRLAGWSRLTLQPGEMRRVSIAAEPRILAEYDTAARGWTIAEGDYRVRIGRNALDEELSGEATLSPQRLQP